MSKKMMLLALAVAALFALPSAASAQEIHISGISTFTGSGGAGSLTTSGEPTLTCTKTNVSTGSFDSGSTTTGKLTLDITGCTSEFLGATPECHTSGAAAGTIASGATFHLITIERATTIEGREVIDKFPAMLLTLNATTMLCSGFSNLTLEGKVIGTITSPACGGSSKTITTSFLSTTSTQEHSKYTGTTYNLTAKTGAGTANATGWNAGTITLTSATTGTLECT